MGAIGILGGTFDPIHLGHLITAQALVEIRNLEKIIFIPCNISPHKLAGNHSDAKHRLEMVRLTTNRNQQFKYSPIEIERSGVSYMVETLRELKKKYDMIELIIGYDNIEKFYTWKEPDEILTLAKLIVLKRKVEKEIPVKDKYYNSAIFVETPTIDIKATEIRERVRRNLSIDFFVTDEVKDYIIKNNLYKS
ncbi:MAG: nicotinate-nucleotide adenylyltransferase [Ignavibacteriales bacterium]|nr:nicotinate-nucleotide adenylyltransferase [Ignavibacteriales bacterium]